MKTRSKEFPLEFLNGGMDTRSPSGTLDFATWRLLFNADGSRNALCRMGGFRKYLGDQDCYLNQDLHVQLIQGQSYYQGYTSTAGGGWTLGGTTSGIVGYGAGYDLQIRIRTPVVEKSYCGPTPYTLGNQCKEAITLLHSFQNAQKRRRLIAGTKTRLYASDERGGNWRIIADGLGGTCSQSTDCECSPQRFNAATIGQDILFVNGVDYVLAWRFDAGPTGCASWSAEYIQELLELNFDSAELVESWGGFAFLGGVRADGKYQPGRLYWSDYNDPLAWIPGGESLAGFHDFGAGERILGMKPIGGRLRVYTSHAIYDLTTSANTDLVFNVQEIYRGPHVPVYRNSLVSTGRTHLYWSEDSIFVMAEYDREPTRYEWIHTACAAAFSGMPASWLKSHESDVQPFGRLTRDKCDLVISGYDPKEQAIWWSWAPEGETCPSMSFVIWPATRKSTYFNHGFTAFCSHRPDLGMTVRDYMAATGLCDPTESTVPKEASPCDTTFDDGGFTRLWNATENPDLPADPNSWIPTICGTCINELCANCDTDIRFVMASAEDKALKEFAKDHYYREILSSETPAVWPDSSQPSYFTRGYTTLVQGDAYRFKTDSDKRFRALAVNFVSVQQTSSANLNGAAGYGMQPDLMQWETSEPIPMDAIDYGTSEDSNRAGAVPAFNFYARGSFIAYRIWIGGTGGGACFSSLTAKLDTINNCW